MEERTIRIHLLGSFQAELDEGEQAAFRSDSERALLAFLLVENDRPHRRESLGALLWPDIDEKQARNNLRVALHRMRQTIEANGQEIVRANNRELQINENADVWVDVWAFEDALEIVEGHEHKGLESCTQCQEKLSEAVDLYRGPLLQGFMLEDSQPFLEWAVLKQEWLHRRALESLATLTDVHVGLGDYEKAEGFARRQLALEPWREEAHRQLMHILALRGERSAALTQYEACRKVLEEELGVAPSDTTEKLVERIRSGERYGEEQRGRTKTKGKPESAASTRGFDRRWLLGIAGAVLLVVLGFVGLRGVWSGSDNGDSLVVPVAGVYDDFSDPDYEGISNDKLWVDPPYPEIKCIFEQRGGLLAAYETPSLQASGCSLRVKQPLNVLGKHLGSIGAQMQLMDDHNGGVMGTVLRMGTHNEDLGVRLDCGFFAGDNRVAAGFVVADEKGLGGNEIIYNEQIPINYNTWYVLELKADEGTEKFTCSVNGVEVGVYTPTAPTELAESIFTWEIGSWREDGAMATVLLDDVQLHTQAP